MFFNFFTKNLTKIFFLVAFGALLVTILSGLLIAIYYTQQGYCFLKNYGITFRELQPIHTIFSFFWIFLGSIGVIYSYLSINNVKLHGFLHCVPFFTWFFTGIFIFITILFGVVSGREYLGFHPLFSSLILLGWLFFLFSFFKNISPSTFITQPIYVYFWSVGILFFVYSFIEGHLWLISSFWRLPIVDLQIQWKGMGSLVASFNMLVYGSFAYLSRCLGDKDYTQSNVAFILFGVGLLNSFTNYTHHTYHIPQMTAVKWFGFFVSMAEIFIFIKIINDILLIFRCRSNFFLSRNRIIYFFVNSVKWWNLINLFLSILISIPFLNTIVHGTQVVFVHVMGSMIGIDTLIIFSLAAFFILNDRSVGLSFLFYLIIILNCFLFLFVLFFCYFGIICGLHVYLGDVNYLVTSYYAPVFFVIISIGLFTSLFFIIIIFCFNCISDLKYRLY